MGRIFDIKDVTVLKNITEQTFFEIREEIETLANSLAEKLLDDGAILDIGKDTMIRVLQNSDVLIIQYDDTKHFAEHRIANWF